MPQVVRGQSRRTRHSVASASLLALAMSMLATLVPSSPAHAAESCATILTDLRAQYVSTTTQLNVVISQHADANGKVDLQFIVPILMAYDAQTATAFERLRILTNVSPVTCGTVPVNTTATSLVAAIRTVVMGAKTAAQVVPANQAGMASTLIRQIDTRLATVMTLIGNIHALSGINFRPLTAALVKADANLVAALNSLVVGFPSLRIYCGI